MVYSGTKHFLIRNTFIVVFLTYQTQLCSAASCNRNMMNLGQVISQLLYNYDTHLLPDENGVDVQIELHVQGISEISELTADFTMDMMYSEIWYDPRLAFKSLENVCSTNITLKSDFRNKIWTPDTCIINSKQSQIHKSPSENSFVLLYEEGRVWANYRMKVRAPCRMDFKRFPFDSQQCMLDFESYSFNAAEVRLRWFNESDPVTLMDWIQLPDFKLLGWSTETQSLNYPNGAWQRAKVTFVFSRRYGFYLFQTYFPTSLTVISSWVSFYLEPRSVSARITLGVSSLLALTFQFGNVLRHLPRVSYVKSIDVWMIGSVVFVFMTLIQLAVVAQLWKLEQERTLGETIINQWRRNAKAKRAERDKLLNDLNNGSVALAPLVLAGSLTQIRRSSSMASKRSGGSLHNVNHIINSASANVNIDTNSDSNNPQQKTSIAFIDTQADNEHLQLRPMSSTSSSTLRKSSSTTADNLKNQQLILANHHSKSPPPNNVNVNVSSIDNNSKLPTQVSMTENDSLLANRQRNTRRSFREFTSDTLSCIRDRCQSFIGNSWHKITHTRAVVIDKWSIVLFPMSYVAFVGIYVFVYIGHGTVPDYDTPAHVADH